jgi:phosphoribosylformylglycinamidine synthase
VYRQYDHQLFLNTVVAPGGDAALLRLAGPGVPSPHPDAPIGIALSTDGNSRWCSLDPRTGTALVVAESALNVACAGGHPVALVNCLNFGNPEHPEVMWQLSEAIDGMAEACLALGIPVIGGNVSLYNESRGRDIDPTPVVGTLGLVERIERPPAGIRLSPGSRLLLAGAITAPPSLAGSKWAADCHNHRGGVLPRPDFDLHARLLTAVADLARGPLLDGVHDVSEGGLGVALAEMAVYSQVGLRVTGLRDHVDLFGEAPSRIVLAVTVANVPAVTARLEAAGLPYIDLGVAGGDRLVVDGLLDVGLEEATEAWKTALPKALAVATTH